MWTAVTDFVYTHFRAETRTIWYLLGSYLALYILGFTVARVLVSTRKGIPPFTDSIGRWTLTVGFLAVTALPIYYIVVILNNDPLDANWQRVVFYGFFVLLNILALASLIGRR
jgi:hypothetical protein